MQGFLSTLSLRRATVWAFSAGFVFLFLSTLSLRRATPGKGPTVKGYWNFYPRSPCGERLVHALELADTMLFLSTLSLRRATLRVLDGSKSSIISIHALLAESDGTKKLRIPVPAYFYPRSPCGERPAIGRRGRAARGNFYPRSPCGERRHNENR